MAQHKRLNPRHKRPGDGTLAGKIRTRPSTKEYRERFNDIFSREKSDHETPADVQEALDRLNNRR